MKKFLSITVVCLTAYVAASAQSAKFGVSAGVAVANYTTTLSGVSLTDQSKTGIAVGILVDIPMSKSFSFQPGLNYVQKGTKEDLSDNGTTASATLSVNHLEVPLNFVFNATGGSGTFFVGAGPSIAYGLSGHWDINDGTQTTNQDVKFGSTENDDLKQIDLGANFLAGYRFNNGFMFSACYNAGLSNLMPVAADGSVKAHYFGFKVGFLFGGSGKK